MLDNIVISKYYNINSDIHSLNPLSKIISMLIFIISFLLIDNINIILIMFVFEIIIFFVTNLPFKIILKNILGLKYLLLFIILINIFTKSSLINTVILIIKIIGITICANIFVCTTTTSAILKGLNKLLSPLRIIGINTELVSLIISLALQFIPITIEEANRILKSLKSRGLSDESNLKTKILGLKSLILPLYISSFRKADILSDIMELRFYSLNNKKVTKKINWNYLDISFVIIHVIILVIVMKEVVL